jgi:hypothetical protein
MESQWTIANQRYFPSTSKSGREQSLPKHFEKIASLDRLISISFRFKNSFLRESERINHFVPINLFIARCCIGQHVRSRTVINLTLTGNSILHISHTLGIFLVHVIENPMRQQNIQSDAGTLPGKKSRLGGRCKSPRLCVCVSPEMGPNAPLKQMNEPMRQ